MTATEAQEELTLLRAAKSRLLSGGVASYAINGRSVNYLSLRDLNEREAVLESIVAAASGRRTMVARFRRTT